MCQTAPPASLCCGTRALLLAQINGNGISSIWRNTHEYPPTIKKTMANPLRVAEESQRQPILHHSVQYASKRRITRLYLFVFLCIFIPECFVCLHGGHGTRVEKRNSVGLDKSCQMWFNRSSVTHIAPICVGLCMKWGRLETCRESQESLPSPLKYSWFKGNMPAVSWIN